MGLDISAYNKIKRIDTHFNDEGEPIDKVTGKEIECFWFRAWVNPSFPERATQIVDDAIYKYASSIGFHAGSYGGYNSWREMLAKLAGYPLGKYYETGKESHCAQCWQGKTGPFSELINFSDCEGIIDSVVSKKLAKDFADFDERAKDFLPDTAFYSFYRKWKEAFELAADHGAVEFH